MDVRYNECEKFGAKVLCEKEISDQMTVPEWLDKDKIRRAQTLVNKHFFGIFFAHLSGLILLVYIKSILIPLLSTGNSRSVSHLFGRYFRTLIHVKRWYEGDVWDPKHPSYQSIMQVRKMHTMVSKKLNKDKREGLNEMSLSQFDMVVTQFAFVGFLTLFPRQMGFSQSQQDLEAILHYWRGIGSLLGIEDRYNLCNGSVDQIQTICRLILEQKLKKSIIETPEREAIEMSKGIVKAIRVFVRLLTYDGLIKYLFEVMDIQREKRLNLFSMISYHLIKFCFNYLLHVTIFAIIFNNLLRLSIVLVEFRKKSIEKSLAQKYDSVFTQTIQTNTELIPV